VTAPPQAEVVEVSNTLAAPNGPSFAVLSAGSGRVAQVLVPYPSVNCGSVPSIGLRAISVKGPTVYAVPSVVAYQERVTMLATLNKWVNGRWAPVATATGQDRSISLASNSNITFANSDFGLVGPGSYYVTTSITWWTRNSESQAFVVIGQRSLSYITNSDYSTTGSVSMGSGFCTLS
jgi:hypothetical protein